MITNNSIRKFLSSFTKQQPPDLNTTVKLISQQLKASITLIDTCHSIIYHNNFKPYKKGYKHFNFRSVSMYIMHNGKKLAIFHIAKAKLDYSERVFLEIALQVLYLLLHQKILAKNH